MNSSKNEHEKVSEENIQEFLKQKENIAMLASQVARIIEPLAQIIKGLTDIIPLFIEGYINNKESFDNISKLFHIIRRIDNLGPETKSLFWSKYIDNSPTELFSLIKDFYSLSDDEIKKKIKEMVETPDRIVPYLPQSNIDENDFYLGYSILNNRPKHERIKFFKYFKDDLSFNKNVIVFCNLQPEAIPNYINSLTLPSNKILGVDIKGVIIHFLAPAVASYIAANIPSFIQDKTTILEQKEYIVSLQQQLDQIQKELQNQKLQSTPKLTEKEQQTVTKSQID